LIATLKRGVHQMVFAVYLPKSAQANKDYQNKNNPKKIERNKIRAKIDFLKIEP
jgi:hypothetical protein